MIAVRRDSKPPFPHDRKVKWWRWTASVETPMGFKPCMHGWISGTRKDARTAALAAETRLHDTHVGKFQFIRPGVLGAPRQKSVELRGRPAA